VEDDVQHSLTAVEDNEDIVGSSDNGRHFCVLIYRHAYPSHFRSFQSLSSAIILC